MIGRPRAAAGDGPEAIAAAARWLGAGGIVAFPTETYYGLAVDPRQPDAVAALFALKGRDAHAALPLVAASLEQVEQVCGPLDEATGRLARAAWPGPLSVMVAAPPGVAPAVSAGTGNVVVRVSAHPVARALAAAAGTVVTATSANRSAEPPATSVAALGAWVDDERVFVLDGGDTPGGAPSTIVDARESPPRLVRVGAVSRQRVLDLLYG